MDRTCHPDAINSFLGESHLGGDGTGKACGPDLVTGRTGISYLHGRHQDLNGGAKRFSETDKGLPQFLPRLLAVGDVQSREGYPFCKIIRIKPCRTQDNINDRTVFSLPGVPCGYTPSYDTASRWLPGIPC